MKTKRFLITLVLFGALLLNSCNAAARVGELRTESQSVKLGDAKSVSVDVEFGAGVLDLAGGGKNLLDADFTYNVAKLKPEVEYKDGTLVVRQPDISGFPNLVDLPDFRNQWELRLYDGVPIDLSVDIGAGASDLHLAGLSLTKLNVTLGAGTYTVDLTGDWARNLDVTIDAGAALLTVRLPKDVGARVKVASGPHTIETSGLTKDGEFYTNAAYDTAGVTMQIDLEAGIGTINLDVEDNAATMSLGDQASKILAP